MKLDPTVLADLESVSLEELEAAAAILDRAQAARRAGEEALK